VQTAFPQEEECAQAANARSAEESWAAEQAHCGWAQAGCSAVLLEIDSVPAVVPGAAPWADGWVPAYSAQADLVVLMELGSIPADYSERADPREQHCSLDAQPVHWPVAELRRVSPERCKVSLLVSHAQPRGP
jgi:hypothetical protein